MSLLSEHRSFKLLIAFWLAASAAGSFAADKPIDFNRDIRPILSDNCFHCHGPDAKHRQADLRLDRREAAIEAGAIVEGKPDESSIVDRIFSEDAESVMPPPQANKELTKTQKDLLKRWIASGAEYQPHWSFSPIKKPEGSSMPINGLSANYIDHFVDRELADAKVQPSPKAPAWRIVRRLFLDVLGIPPSNLELDTWTRRIDKEGVEPLVDHLLASPRYGERMAIHWLDVVRYSDTVGFHGDQNQNIFPYRDYVIDAFNKNKPFDQFTIEQIAGDLLPNPTEEQLIATGFNRLNMMTREGGAQPGEYLSKYSSDRVRTVGMAWLGATIGCAECHDHKFDPFTAKDFYSLAAFFSDVTQWGVYADYGYTPNPDLKGFNNDYPFPPEIELKSPSLIQRQKKIASEIMQWIRENSLKGPDAKASIHPWAEETVSLWKLNHELWFGLDFVEHKGASEQAILLDSGIVQLKTAPAEAPEAEANNEDKKPKPKGNSAPTARTVIYSLPKGTLARLELSLIPTADHQDKVLRDGASNADIKLKVAINASGKTSPLPIHRAEADSARTIYADGAPSVRIEEIWGVAPKQLSYQQTAVYAFQSPTMTELGDKLEVTITGNKIGAIRVRVSPIADLAARNVEVTREQLEKVAQSKSDSVADIPDSVLRAWYFSTQSLAKNSKLSAMITDYRECRDGKAWSMITVARKPVTTRILPRGNWQDESGAIVDPATPEFLPSFPPMQSDRRTRMDLAKWLIAPENPLTSRVIVNRFWKQFFGNGLCASVDDFGLQGDSPTHPELLDALAIDFMSSGWNVKAIIKKMLLSEAYQRSAEHRADLKEIDPQNKLLAGQNPKRLEAELVRDNALSIAGCLDTEIVGGPSCKPYQPPGYYANLQFPDRDYIPDVGFGQFRRGVYMHWQRTFLHPMLANFDAPSREDCIANRVSSNTPQQALTLLNDPVFFDAAARMACSLLIAKSNSDENRIDEAMIRAVARPATQHEKLELLSFLKTQRTHLAANPKAVESLLSNVKMQDLDPSNLIDRVEAATWIVFCRVVLNLHETFVRY